MAASRPGLADVSTDDKQAVAAKKQAAQQRAEEDRRAGDVWNETFKDKANIRDAKVAERFWTEVKNRFIRKYGSMSELYSAITHGEEDCNMTFAVFNDHLKSIHIHFEQRICRAVFEKATNGERVLNLETLKHLLMETTIKKLRGVMEGCNGRQERVQVHYGKFLRRLVLEDPIALSRAIDRFQIKLTVDFCRYFWELTLKQLGQEPSPSLPIDRVTFQRISRSSIGPKFGMLAYDTVFLIRLFHRIQALNTSVTVCDVIATLLLLSPEPDRLKKVTLLFEVFDSDYDGCLVWDQLLLMFKCLCKQRPVAEASSLVTEDLDFQEELSVQEGLHSYEQTRWQLQRGTNLEGEIVSLRELWVALQKKEDLLHTLLPGSIQMDTWARQPAPFENDIEDALASNAQQPRRRETKSASDPSRPSNLPARNPRPREIRIEESTEPDFKGLRTKKFQESLHSFGQLRLAEFSKGFLTPTVGELEGGIDFSGWPASPTVAGTPANAAGLPSPMGSSMTRASSAPTGLTPTARSGSPASLPATPSPMKRRGLASPGNHSSGLAAGAPASLREGMHFWGVPSIAPSMRSQRWGQESVDRFRLFAAMKGGNSQQKLVTPDKGLSYVCQLCNRPHTFNVDCNKR